MLFFFSCPDIFFSCTHVASFSFLFLLLFFFPCRYIATSYCVESLPIIFGEKRPNCSYLLAERVRSRMVKALWDLDKTATRKSHGRNQLCVSEVVGVLLREWELESSRVDQLWRALFEAADVNGDQELTVGEFRTMLEFVNRGEMKGGSGGERSNRSGMSGALGTTEERTTMIGSPNAIAVKLYQRACTGEFVL